MAKLGAAFLLFPPPLSVAVPREPARAVCAGPFNGSNCGVSWNNTDCSGPPRWTGPPFRGWPECTCDLLSRCPTIGNASQRIGSCVAPGAVQENCKQGRWRSFGHLLVLTSSCVASSGHPRKEQAQRVVATGWPSEFATLAGARLSGTGLFGSGAGGVETGISAQRCIMPETSSASQSSWCGEAAPRLLRTAGNGHDLHSSQTRPLFSPMTNGRASSWSSAKPLADAAGPACSDGTDALSSPG